MKNFEWCVYTYKHRRALVYVIHKLIHDDALKQKMLARVKFHDVDKMLLYLFLDQTESMKYHVEHQPHHLESGKCTSYEDYLEMVLDFECAPYTKPDKPLNAYDFTQKLLNMGWISQEIADILFGIMLDLKIDSSYDITKCDLEGMQFVSELGTITEEMILLDIFDYIKTDPEELVYIQQRLEK